MGKMLDELIMLADIFDAAGLKFSSDVIDGIIKIAVEQKIKRKWLPEIKDLAGKINSMLSDNPNVSKDLREELVSDLNNYLLENERKFKESGSEEDTFKNIGQENVILDSLKNLFAEINDPNITESEKNREVFSIARHMRAFRALESSDKEEDREKAKFIRTGLGEKTIMGIEYLLAKQSHKLGINAFTLPSVMIGALEYYNTHTEKKGKIVAKVQQLERELQKTNQELERYRWVALHDFSSGAKEKASQEARDLLTNRARLNDMQNFYRGEADKTDVVLKEAVVHIKTLMGQLQIIIGSDASAAEQIRSTIGDENLSRLVQIGGGGEQENT